MGPLTNILEIAKDILQFTRNIILLLGNYDPIILKFDAIYDSLESFLGIFRSVDRSADD